MDTQDARLCKGLLSDSDVLKNNRLKALMAVILFKELSWISLSISNSRDVTPPLSSIFEFATTVDYKIMK